MAKATSAVRSARGCVASSHPWPTLLNGPQSTVIPETRCWFLARIELIWIYTKGDAYFSIFVVNDFSSLCSFCPVWKLPISSILKHTGKSTLTMSYSYLNAWSHFSQFYLSFRLSSNPTPFMKCKVAPDSLGHIDLSSLMIMPLFLE